MLFRSADNFQAACSLGFLTGCQNVALATGPASAVRHAPPGLRDYPVVLRTGKGALDDTTPFALYVRACDHGFMEGCQRMAGFYLRGEGTPRDPSKAMAALERSCGGRFGPGCSDLGLMLYKGDGIPQDREKGLSYLKQACAVGYSQACQWYTEQKQ